MRAVSRGGSLAAAFVVLALAGRSQGETSADDVRLVSDVERLARDLSGPMVRDRGRVDALLGTSLREIRGTGPFSRWALADAR